MADSPAPIAPRSAPRWRPTPSGVFAAVLGAFMVWVLIEAPRWPANAQVLPRVVSLFGLLMLAGYVVQNLLLASGRAPGQIMDIGRLDTGALSRREVRTRLALVFGGTAALVVGVWAVGFHVAVPIYVFLWLWRLGGVRWWMALLAAAAFVLLLVGLYDQVIRVTWHETLIDRALGRQR